MPACQISPMISKIKNVDPIQYGKEMLSAISPFASDYINSLREKGLIPNQPIMGPEYSEKSQEEVKALFIDMQSHPFFIWLNKQKELKKFKLKLVKRNIISADLNAVNAESLLSYNLQYAVEFVVANAICQCTANLSDLKHPTFVPLGWKRLPDKYFKEIVLMSRNFELDSEEQLFLKLLDKLQNSDGTVYNSGKPHDFQVRELLIKRVMQGLFFIFGVERLTNTFVADLSLAIAAIFFDEMKRADAISLSKKVRENVIKEAAFLRMTVSEILFQ